MSADQFCPRQVTKLLSVRSADNQSLNISIESIYPNGFGDWTNYNAPRLVLSTNNNRAPGSNSAQYVSAKISLGYTEAASIVTQMENTKAAKQPLNHTEYSGQRCVVFQVQVVNGTPSLFIQIMDPHSSGGTQKATLRFTSGSDIRSIFNVFKQYADNYVVLSSNATSSLTTEWAARFSHKQLHATNTHFEQMENSFNRVTDILVNMNDGIEALCTLNRDNEQSLREYIDGTQAVLAELKQAAETIAATAPTASTTDEWGFPKYEELSDEERRRRAIESENEIDQPYLEPDLCDDDNDDDHICNDAPEIEQPTPVDSEEADTTDVEIEPETESADTTSVQIEQPTVDDDTAKEEIEQRIEAPEVEVEMEMVVDSVTVDDPPASAETDPAVESFKSNLIASLMNGDYNSIDLGIDPNVYKSVEKRLTREPKRVLPPMPLIGDTMKYDAEMGATLVCMSLYPPIKKFADVFFPFSRMLSDSSVIDAPFNFIKIESMEDLKWMMDQSIMYMMFHKSAMEFGRTSHWTARRGIKYAGDRLEKIIPQPGTQYYEFMLEALYCAVVYKNFYKAYMSRLAGSTVDNAQIAYNLLFSKMLVWFYGQIFYHMGQRHPDGHTGIVMELTKVYENCVECGFMRQLGEIYNSTSMGGVMEIGMQDIRSEFYGLMDELGEMFDNDYFIDKTAKQGTELSLWVNVKELVEFYRELNGKLPTLEEMKDALVKAMKFTVPETKPKTDERLALLYACIDRYMENRDDLDKIKSVVTKYEEFACAVEDLKIIVPDIVRAIRRTMDNDPNLVSRSEIIRKAKAMKL